MKDIIEAVDGSLAPVECVDNPKVCDRIHTCAARDVWEKLKAAMEDILESATLESLTECQEKKKPPTINYTI